MSTIKVITLDDNENELDQINLILKKIDNVKIIKSFRSHNTLIEFLEKNSCDIIFSDIEVGKKNSIEILKTIDNLPEIVFVSSFPKYAHKSFSVDPLHYIVKPVSRCEVLTSIDRFINKNTSPDPSSFFVKRLHSKSEKIYFNNILFIESNNDSIKIRTEKDEIETLSSIKKVLEKLPDEFIRVHRSFIINKRFIDSFSKKNLKIQDYTIPISRAYKKEVLETIHEL